MKGITCGRALAAGLLSAIALGSFATATPAAAGASGAANCASLAAWVAQQPGINKAPVDPGEPGSRLITAAKPVQAATVTAAEGNLPYCQVVFQLSPAITINVGLPLNRADGGNGAGCSNVASAQDFYGSTGAVNNSCYTGNWNGKIEAIGNGGYAGTVPSVISATNTGFVGSSTDNGHSANWCNAINPTTGLANSQHNCGIDSRRFRSYPNNNLLTTEITDFIDTSEVEQTKWAQTLAEYYYGSNFPIKRTYWNGCSTGGRQGFQMAQFHPGLFDGILVGSSGDAVEPLHPWLNLVLGGAGGYRSLGLRWYLCPDGTSQSCNPSYPVFLGGSSQAFTNAFTAATNAAVAACDGIDGVMDGVVNEPRLRHFSARSMIGTTVAPMTSPMTEAQAIAIDLCGTVRAICGGNGSGVVFPVARFPERSQITG